MQEINIQDRVQLRFHENGTAYVCLHRPEKRNALDLAMFKAIDHAISYLAKQKHVRVVILTGSGDDFCSGLDVKSVMGNPTHALRLLVKLLPWRANLAQRVSVGWRKLNVPVIAVLHGRCWGGGMQIALGADFRIAASNASLSVMEARWGLIPDMGGTVGMLENMPCDTAMLAAMTGEEYTAEQAKSLSLISSIADDPFDAAETLVEQLLSRSPDSVRFVKQLYHKVWASQAGTALSFETWYQLRVLMGKNQRIAVKRQQGSQQPYI